MLQKIRIGTRLSISILLLILPLFLIGVISYWDMEEIIGSLKTIYEDRVIPLSQLKQVADLYAVQIVDTTHKVRSGSVSWQNGLKNVHTARSVINQKWDAFLLTYMVEEEKALVEKARPLLQEANRSLENLETILQKQDAVALTEYVNADLYPTIDPISEVFSELVEVQLTVAKREYESSEKSYKSIMLLFFGILCGSIVFSALIGFVLTRSITAPLHNMLNRIRDLAEGEGDLRKRIDLNSQDELKDMADWLNKFINVIHSIVKEVSRNLKETYNTSQKLKEASLSLSSGTEQISLQSQTIAASATQLNQNLQIVSSSTEEISISVGEVAQRSTEAAVIANEANTKANNSNQIFQELELNAGEIGKVIETISKIAQQTNLLALNASIEAASAGNAGKGFAVVASEVKELARQSSESSSEIKSRIQAIQSSTKDTITIISEINDVIKKINDINSAIASSVEEQSITAKEVASNSVHATTASNEVTQNISGISDAVKITAKDAENISGLADALNDMANQLNNSINRFKV